MQLNAKSLLQGGKYRIESVLGQGGFGITYLAEQVGLNRQVAIKEFFMKEYCNRDETTSQVSVPSVGSKKLVNKFKIKFIKEAQTIAKLDHPNIIRIYDIFEENGTAYYVMEYLPYGNLRERIPSKGMPESEAVGYIKQISSALSYIHSNNILHLDIKPSNVLFRKSGDAVLIDFGESKHYDSEDCTTLCTTVTTSTPVAISHGYAPTEQCETEGGISFSAATDIYALGATLYCMVVGESPPKASIVLNEGLPALPRGLSSSVRAAIESAMQPKRNDRPQSIAEFLQLLEEAETESETPKKRGWLYGAIACVVAVVLTIFVVSVIQKRTEADERAQNDSLEYSTLIASADSLSQKGDKTSLERSKAKYVAASKYEEEYGKGRYSDMFSKNASKSATELQNRIESLVAAEEAAKYNGHEYVDLGLSVKWATCNVGATTPEGYGNYYAWGETAPKSNYTWETYKFRTSGDSYKNVKFNKYNTSSDNGTIDNKTTLDLSDDAARVNWGGSWRMPTRAELDELRNNCTWTWTTQNGINGYKVTSKTNGNSIFLPAVGIPDGTSVYYVGSWGNYWSSSLYESYPSLACSLYFYSDTEGEAEGEANDTRDEGYSVRAVCP